MKEKIGKSSLKEKAFMTNIRFMEKCPWNEASCTIKENHGGVNIHPIEPRVITAREMARLQSFQIVLYLKGRNLNKWCKLKCSSTIISKGNCIIY
jgi:DNA (cytosine-5)-methyltransferase 1